MEKYAVNSQDLREDLINEEHTLMLRLSDTLIKNHKTAQENNQIMDLQARLNAVREKIYELDISKKQN